ncbi:MAG: transglutaminase-like domain-containing protein, partial [Eubacterium sp.]
AVYAYIKDNVVYDVKKAQSIQDGYIPVVDDTYATNKGICFDYASLAAAMLRSCGIPAMVQTGYVSPSGVYHAWNMVYLKDSGWVEVGFKADQNTWTQVDLTFAASSSKTDLSNFIGDNGTYETKYTY